LYVSGRIGGSMKKFHLLRFITDLIFFIFFGLLFENIVSGIMIDTFVELRNKRDQMHEDKKNKCYICGKDRGKVTISLIHSCKKIMRILKIISIRSTSFGTISIMSIVSIKSIRLNIVDWSIKSKIV
jgi:hypothetical protein